MSSDPPDLLPSSGLPPLRILGILTRFKAGVGAEIRAIETLLDQGFQPLLETFKMVEVENETVRLTEEGAATAKRLVADHVEGVVDPPSDLFLFSIQAAGMPCFGRSYDAESEHCGSCDLAFACREALSNHMAHLALQLNKADETERNRLDAESKASAARERLATQEQEKAELREKANINDVMRRLRATAPSE